MELSAEKFENEENQNNSNTEIKKSFNINEIKAYLENNNNLDELDPHLITDINNNFSSSRKNIFQQTSNNQSNYNDNDNEEDLIMNKNYNYNPLSSLNSSSQNPTQTQKILQISPNQNKYNNNYHINNSEIRTFNHRIFAEISTKKSTKTLPSLMAS